MPDAPPNFAFLLVSATAESQPISMMGTAMRRKERLPGKRVKPGQGLVEFALAVIVTIICDRGDRYLSTGVFPD